jgi:hypothetical protein
MWLQQTPQSEFSRLSILRYRDALLHRKHLAPKSINLQLTALRKLAKEAVDEGLIDDRTAAGILRIPMVPNRGVRAGVWLAREQAQRILSGAERADDRGQTGLSRVDADPAVWASAGGNCAVGGDGGARTRGSMGARESARQRQTAFAPFLSPVW